MKPCVAVALLALLGVLDDAQFVVKRRSIAVLSPHKLMTEKDGAIANFGNTNYEGFIIGSVVYPKKDSLGCQVFEGNKPFNFQSHRLLDRGGCYFALKVWNAEQAGAAAVLVTDNIDEALITMDFPDECDDDSLVADGFIKNISILSALIEKTFGDMLKEALNNKDEVFLRIDRRESTSSPRSRVDQYEFSTNKNHE